MNQDEAKKTLADIARQREAGKPAYTLADAIVDAKFYRSRPDILVDSKHARRVIDTLLTGLEQKKQAP